MSATSLVTTAGARTRLANITAAAVMAVVILLFGDLAGAIAMPALAGLLMVIGVRTFKPDRVRMVWRTGPSQAIVMVTTFVLTIVIPLQYAVLIGVAASVILFVGHQSNKVTVVCWVFPPGSALPREEPAPAELPPGEVVVLMVYGSVFFASAQVIEAQLPAVTPTSTGSVVVLRLRGKEDLGSTFIRVMMRYADALHAAGGHLILAGVGQRVLNQLTATRALDVLGQDNVFPSTEALGTAVTSAIARANELLSHPGRG